MTAFLNYTPLLSLTPRPCALSHSACAKRTAITSCSQRPNDSQPHSLDTLLQTLRKRPTDPPAEPRAAAEIGTVYLVGTGPGDPGLLTLRALHLITRADVILYDRLVSDSILSFVNPKATMVYVGKEAGFHTRSQEDIHLLLSFFAKSHRVIVRLKGGDPFVFGRGGEETDFLESASIRVIAVPGITAASGIAAALSIPLTMRGLATSVRYVTGHITSGVNIDFGAVDHDTTYVIYMGLGQLPTIADQFISRGLTDTTPAVAIERGTTPEQRVVAGYLKDMPGLVSDAAFKSPTLVIVGQVVTVSPCWLRRGHVIENENIEMPSFDSLNDPALQRALQTLDAEQF